MARPARGAEVLEMAREMVARATTIEQLRQAQAVVLPLDFGLSMEQTAAAIGRRRSGPVGCATAFWPARSSAMASASAAVAGGGRT